MISMINFAFLLLHFHEYFDRNTSNSCRSITYPFSMRSSELEKFIASNWVFDWGRYLFFFGRPIKNRNLNDYAIIAVFNLIIIWPNWCQKKETAIQIAYTYLEIQFVFYQMVEYFWITLLLDILWKVAYFEQYSWYRIL